MFTQTNPVRIPSEFMLLGHRYRVVMVDSLFETEGTYGTADDDMKQICLQTPGVVKKRYKDDVRGDVVDEITITPEILIETFFHEVTHIMLDAMGEDTLSENERFVNLMGKLWLEIYLSSVYEKDSTKTEV